MGRRAGRFRRARTRPEAASCPAGFQSSGEFASADPTAGAQDATLQERGLSPEVPLNARRRLRHFQRPTPSHVSSISPRATRRGDACGDAAFRVFGYKLSAPNQPGQTLVALAYVGGRPGRSMMWTSTLSGTLRLIFDDMEGAVFDPIAERNRLEPHVGQRTLLRHAKAAVLVRHAEVELCVGKSLPLYVVTGSSALNSGRSPTAQRRRDPLHRRGHLE